VLYPWPHSLQAFDPATPQTAFVLSLGMGFVLAPFLTYKWGIKGFCGYICPHGAFFLKPMDEFFLHARNDYNGLPDIFPLYILL
jgi:hypothetical protein